MKITLNTFFIIAGFAILFWLIKCGNKPVSNTTVTTHDTIIIKDNSTHTTTIENHHWHDRPVYIEIPAKIDSDAVVIDYFTHHPFTDSIVDSNGTFVYSGDIWKGSMFNQDFHYRWDKPQTIITNTTIHPAKLHNKIYLGAFLSFRNPEPTVGAFMSFQDKHDRILTIGYGTGPTYLIGTQWKISFRRQGKPP